MVSQSEKELLHKIEELENRLNEAEQLIDAIKAGEVDAFALNKNNKPEVFTLQSGDYAYRVLVENFREGALNLTEDGLIVYTNSYFPNLLGIPYEDVIAHSIFEFIHPESKDTFGQLFRSGFSTQSKGELNLLIGGTTIPVYMSFTSLRPTLDCVGVIVTDLTEKKKRERELEEKNRFIETIIDSSNELISVYSTDYTLLSINKATENFLGMSKSSMIGKKFTELFPQLAGTKAEKDLAKTFKGEFVKNQEYPLFYNNHYIDNYITPLRNERGEVYAALAIGHDMTEIKRTEEDLKKSQQRFVKLFTVSPVAMSLSRASDGKVIDVNKAWGKMFEFDPQDLIGRNADEILVNFNERDLKIGQIKESGGSLHGLELNFQLPSGKSLDAFVSIESIELDGELCFLTAYFDLRERIRAEEMIRNANRLLEEKNVQLEQTNTELASFSFVASHDLQEPLRKIQTFSNRILDLGEKEFSPEMKDYFLRILSATTRMKNLISDLLNYSRMSTSELKFERTDLNALVQEVINNLEERITETNAVIHVGPLPAVEGIPYQIGQLFGNILSNAIKYRRPGVAPKIEIAASVIEGSRLSSHPAIPNGKYYKITISDNGIGFEPIHASKIFELFQRLHGVNQYEGTGIGLAICKKIMQNHKGFIEAEGSPEVGSVFTLYLPINSHET